MLPLKILLFITYTCFYQLRYPQCDVKLYGVDHVTVWPFKAKSKSRYDWRPVSRPPLALNPLWVSWPDFSFCLDIYSLCRRQASSDLSFLGSLSFCVSVFLTIFIHTISIENFLHHICTVGYLRCPSRRCVAYRVWSYFAYAITTA
jgi:hypothetical protein